MTGKLEFTQFDPMVAETHSSLQGLKWEGNSIKRVEKRIKLDQKFDEVGYHRDQDRISESDIGIEIGYHSDLYFFGISGIGYRTRCTENS